MASNSKIINNLKQKKIANETFKERAELKAKMKKTTDPKEKQQLCLELDKMPPAHRHRNRCVVCGRPRGVKSRYGLCRIHMREFSAAGKLPGLYRRRKK